ncbi:FHA domain-containing protein [Acidaminobacter sp. JC074]|uniref:FHA domain-containing protein n=1 Tax=Acidaminobacter sp. JC074 TaxID=2530199 RepID=UPI001F0DA155|nr:FHA domain-containing protein [Acidaminobacter sp. JC074]MCH4887764.1 FHA domain-containing protein [Acidaminobacter sp. JC074]
MHLFKEMNGPYTILGLTYQEEDLISYQHEMILYSDQSVFIQGKLDGRLKYDVTSLIPIEVYFKNHCKSFEKQKHIMKKLIDSLWTADRYLLDSSKIVLDKTYVFIDVQSICVRLLYIPLHSYNVVLHKSMRELFLSLLFTIDLSIIEGDTRVKKMIAYLQDTSFDVMVFDAMLTSLKQEKKGKKDWIKSLFKKEKEKLVDYSQTVIMPQEEKQRILDFEHGSIPINKASFLIGRSKSLVDYALPEALTIGRVHAELVKESDDYYIVDINTKNGTFVNGERLESQKKYKLNSGDAIKFGKEEAIFK